MWGEPCRQSVHNGACSGRELRLETLGEKLSIPPRLEQMREQIEETVRPLVNPRTAARTQT